MKASIKDFEIMAPVGSRESLAAAIQAGARCAGENKAERHLRGGEATHRKYKAAQG